MTHVNVGTLSTSFAITNDEFVLGDDQLCFGVLARSAEDELVDETVEEIAESGSFVSAVDDVTFRVVVEGRLGSKLAAEELGGVCTRGRGAVSTDGCEGEGATTDKQRDG